VSPYERVISAINHDKLRTRDAIVEHLCVVDRYSPIVRAGNHKRRTPDLGQALPAIEGHRFLPRSQHQGAVLVRHEISQPVGAFIILF
jgi:hypothetical protein